MSITCSNRIFMSITYSILRHQKLTKTLEKDIAKSLTNKLKGPQYTIFGTHQILINLHFASPLAKQNEKHNKSKKHKSAFMGEMIAFSICNKPFKPLGISSGRVKSREILPTMIPTNSLSALCY